MRDKVRIQTERLVIRLADTGEGALISQYYTDNRERLAPLEPTRSEEFFTTEFWEKTIPKLRENFLSDRSLSFFLFYKNQIVGVVAYSNFSRGAFQACNLGYSISRNFEGKGLMIEALKTTNRYVFEELRFHRIMANYIPRNLRSAALLKKLGFSIEGQARDYLQIQGKWQDHVLTSLIYEAPPQ